MTYFCLFFTTGYIPRPLDRLWSWSRAVTQRILNIDR